MATPYQAQDGTAVIFCPIHWEQCYKCGLPFGVTKWFHERRVSDGRRFWCPNGHGQRYPGKDDKPTLEQRQELIAALHRAEQAEAVASESQILLAEQAVVMAALGAHLGPQRPDTRPLIADPPAVPQARETFIIGEKQVTCGICGKIYKRPGVGRLRYHFSKVHNISGDRFKEIVLGAHDVLLHPKGSVQS